MLSKARHEEGQVKTVSLARGVVTTPNIPTSSPHLQHPPTSSRGSSERVLTTRSRSPESSHGAKDMPNLLNSIGIVELLEQDERPTFIVDLGDKSNYGPGPLQLVFANLALRTYNGLEALVSGSAEDASPVSQNVSPIQVVARERGCKWRKPECMPAIVSLREYVMELFDDQEKIANY